MTDDDRNWRDRDTEPIPRARNGPEPANVEPPRSDPPPPPAAEDDPGYLDYDRDVGLDDVGLDDVGLDDEDYRAGVPFGDREPPPEPMAFDPGPPPGPETPFDYRLVDEEFVDDDFAAANTVGASFVVGEPITEEELSSLRGGAGTPLVTSRRVVPLEDEPSTLVQRYLFPTEKFRGEWRRHPIELAKEIGIAAGATIVMGLLTGYLTRVNARPEYATILVLAWLAVLIWVAWQIADWWYDRFILTNKRVMVVSGIITRNVAMMPLQRVTDMKYVQSAIGRMLNYGTFELESAGQDQALRSIPHLPSPNELYLRIVEEMYEPEAVEARLAGAQDVIDDGT
jgi:membrane protein YdbS with pleckstrin-like domain